MTDTEVADLCARAFPKGTRTWTADAIGQTRSAPGAIFVTEGPALALGRVAAGEAELFLIVTDPDAQRQGHAARCLSAFEMACRAVGAELVHLELRASNTAAYALYEAAGYRRVGERPNYYPTSDGGREAAVLMQKRF
ncbi:MAG: GNAT family N-acetyltransferase [Pseudomonadota bacterium]